MAKIIEKVGLSNIIAGLALIVSIGIPLLNYIYVKSPDQLDFEGLRVEAELSENKPRLTIPATYMNGPIAFHALMSLAADLERARPWFERRPNL